MFIILYFCVSEPKKQSHLTEINIELAEINAQDFYGANNEHLKRIKEYYPKLKIVARGRELTVFGNEDVLKVFDQKMQRVIQHIHKYNRLSDRELEIIMTEDNNEMLQIKKEDEIIVHGVNGKIIKPQTPNQQKLVQTVYNKDMVFAIGPAGTGKTYTAVALSLIHI